MAGCTRVPKRPYRHLFGDRDEAKLVAEYLLSYDDPVGSRILTFLDENDSLFIDVNPIAGQCHIRGWPRPVPVIRKDNPGVDWEFDSQPMRVYLCYNHHQDHTSLKRRIVSVRTSGRGRVEVTAMCGHTKSYRLSDCPQTWMRCVPCHKDRVRRKRRGEEKKAFRDHMEALRDEAIEYCREEIER